MAERAIPIVVLLLAFLRCASGEGRKKTVYSDFFFFFLPDSYASKLWTDGTLEPMSILKCELTLCLFNF